MSCLVSVSLFGEARGSPIVLWVTCVASLACMHARAKGGPLLRKDDVVTVQQQRGRKLLRVWVRINSVVNTCSVFVPLQIPQAQ